MGEHPSLGSLPTVQPADIQWLEATRPLLALPAGTVVVNLATTTTTLPSPAALERWAAFFAAAVAFEADWGVRRGAVRLTTIDVEGVPVDVIASFGRIALISGSGSFADLPRPKDVGRRLVEAVSAGERYRLDLAATAYVLEVLEDSR